MKTTGLLADQFKSEEAARQYLESIRWPNGPVCPHCGNTEKIYRLEGKATRKGVLKCAKCRKQFTVTVDTLFADSHISLDKWLYATYLICSSKKGMSSHQLHRMLDVTYKSAWFMTHRIREAMKTPEYLTKLGGEGKFVEADETYWGNNDKQRKGARGADHKMKVVVLVERGGEARSFHVKDVTAKTLRDVLNEQASKESHLMTDEHKSYNKVGKEFADHSIVKHSMKQYVKGIAHINTAENFFSLLKRGLVGTFHHVGEQHLQKYTTEFDFRYNHRKENDSLRTDAALKGIEGKRLYYSD